MLLLLPVNLLGVVLIRLALLPVLIRQRLLLLLLLIRISLLHVLIRPLLTDRLLLLVQILIPLNRIHGWY